MQVQLTQPLPVLGEPGLLISVGYRAILLTTAATVLSVWSSEVLADCSGTSTTSLSQESVVCIESNAPRNGAIGKSAVPADNRASVSAAVIYGIEAVGKGISIVQTDGEVATTLDNVHGVYAASGGTIILTRTNVITSGMFASAVFADTGGSITLNDLSTFTYGDDAPNAVASGSGSSLTLNNTYVNVWSNGSAGLFATDGGMITVNGGATTTGDYYGGTLIANSPGMLARGLGSIIQVGNGATSATYGANSAGVWADAGGRIDFSGYGIFTYQPNSPGAVADGAGSTVTLTNTINRTSGSSSAGLLVTDAGTMIVTGTEVTTGFRVTGDSTPVLQFPDAEIGLEAHGADVIGAGSQLQAENSWITTNGGYGAYGVRVSQGANASIVGGSIITTGSDAHGIVGIEGSTLTTNGTSITVSGTGSSAIYLTGSAPSVLSVTGGRLNATNGAIVLAKGGTGTVSISDGTVITPAYVNERLLLAEVSKDTAGTPTDLTLNISSIPALTGDVVVDSSTLAYNLSDSAWTGNLLLNGIGASANLSASQWTGDLQANVGNTADVVLAQGSLWTGVAQNATDVTIDASSAWNVTGNSNATAAVTNSGLIQFSDPIAGVFKTLTAGNYIGASGMLGLNTVLGADDSASDHLIVDGGTASGATSVLVKNAGGAGAKTVNDGILLVDTINGGTTTPDSFSLHGRVIAGPYEYSLYRGGLGGVGENWYLRSVLDCNLAPNADVCQSVTPNPSEPAAYRPEVSLYSAIPALALKYGSVLMDTFDERMGAQRSYRHMLETDNIKDRTRLGWGRVVGVTGSRDGGTLGIYGKEGPSYDYDIFALQTGADIFRVEHKNGSFDNAGVYVAYGKTNSDVTHFDGKHAGTDDLEGWTVGGYWTHFGATGWYFDGVMQGTWYSATASSGLGAGLDTNGFGFGASLESGYPIQLQDGWAIEPQAQLAYQTINLNDASDGSAFVGFEDVESLVGRIGARLSRDWNLGEPHMAGQRKAVTWLRASLTNEFLGTPKTQFSSAGGFVPFDARTRGAGMALNVGFDADIARNVSFYGSAGYDFKFGGNEDSFNGKLGLKARF